MDVDKREDESGGKEKADRKRLEDDGGDAGGVFRLIWRGLLLLGISIRIQR